MANTQTKLNNINLLNKTQYDSSSKSTNELWAVDVDGDSAFKERVDNWGMPDYSKAFTVSLPYTPTQNGVFFYKGSNSSNSTVKFSVGGVECWFNGYGTANGGSFLVPKNATISGIAIPLSGPVFIFVPCIGG